LRLSRTTEHIERVADRRERLRDTLLKIIPPSSPFVWEVGCGHGHFLAAYAAAHPKEECIGIDISADRITRANRKRDRAKIKNLQFVLADADDFLAVMPKKSRFSAIYILFPDPWPKRRHHKNRVLKPAFLAASAGASAKGTQLYFRTDHEGYFLEGKAVFRSSRDWSASEETLLPFEEPTVFQKRAASHFTLVAKRC
jgi:tRNA (guanine-N7-)-methyltransferase